MSQTLQRIQELALRREVRISAHGYDELALIPRNASSPAVVVTAYRPDPDEWTEDFLRRR